MKIAIFCNKYSEEIHPFFEKLFNELIDRNLSLIIPEKYADVFIQKYKLPQETSIFNSAKGIINKVDYVFSIGGDGTLLNSISYVKNSNIPVMGFNTGRLGFLSAISQDEISSAINDIVNKNYTLDKRKLLQLKTPENIFKKQNFALNEITVHKKDSASMISIVVHINNQYLNTYWADGLIISTPTGSTAYSLSCGGPILTPDSENIIINPIATHTLTVRPIVIPDNSLIKLKINSNYNNFLLTLDSLSETLSSINEFEIQIADFKINLVQLKNKSFFSTIREKLMWGIDKRN